VPGPIDRTVCPSSILRLPSNSTRASIISVWSALFAAKHSSHSDEIGSSPSPTTVLLLLFIHTNLKSLSLSTKFLSPLADIASPPSWAAKASPSALP
jgi:hypothetical protein